VFLTATPIQLSSQDLFALLNLSRPELILDTRRDVRMRGVPRKIISLIGMRRTGKSTLHSWATRLTCLGGQEVVPVRAYAPANRLPRSTPSPEGSYISGTASSGEASSRTPSTKKGVSPNNEVGTPRCAV
jgi:hypothetical protein